MIDPGLLAAAFERNTRVIALQISGLDHGDSLVQSPYRINCLNWTLGHVLDGRGRVLEMLGRERVVPAGETARYVRESDPILEDGPGVLRLERLSAGLEESGRAITAALEALDAAALGGGAGAGPEGAASLGERLHGEYFHDTYHTGQAELLRQVAGVGDKVI